MNYDWSWRFLFGPSLTGEGSYVVMLMHGFGWTILISLTAWLIALAFGIALGVARTLPRGVLRRFATLYVHLFRNTPLLVQLFLWYFVLPEWLPKAWGDTLKSMNLVLNQVLTVLLCLSLYTAAKVAEHVRAGIASLPAGQYRAAQALGFGVIASYRHVVLPQAFRIALPPLTSELMNVFKNSAVAMTIGLMELTGTSRQVSEFSGHPFEAFAFATLGYMLIALVAARVMRVIEARSRISGATQT